MQESAGRHQGAIHIDFTSIELLDEDRKAQLYQQYCYLVSLNLCQQTSLTWGCSGYAEAYLKQHEAISPDCLCMVRELALHAPWFTVGILLL